MGIINYNGKSSFEYGLQVEEFPSYNIPEKLYEVINVPGRNGDIYISKDSYSNVEMTYKLAFGADKPFSFSEQVLGAINWLHSATGYTRLEDTYDPDHYRLAVFKDNPSITNLFHQAGRFEAKFDCKPQRYLKSGDNSIVTVPDATAGTILPFTINNPTQFNARPVIKLQGSGKNTVYINGTSNPLDVTFMDVSVAHDGTTAGITDAYVDADIFSQYPFSQSASSYTFNCTGNSCQGVVHTTHTPAFTISSMTSKVENFIAAVGTRRPKDYTFSYLGNQAAVEPYNCNKIKTTTYNADTIANNFSTQATPIWTCTQAEATAEAAPTGEYSGNYIPVDRVTIAPLQYRTKLADIIGNAESSSRYIDYNLGKEIKLKFVATVEGPSTRTWNVSIYNGTVWLSVETVDDLNEYGISIDYSGSFDVGNGDWFTTVYNTYWTRTDISDQAESTTAGNPYDIHTDGLPMPGDQLLMAVIPKHWEYDDTTITLSDTAFPFFTVTSGTPANGDYVVVTIADLWALNGTAISIADCGITYKGIPLTGDKIVVSTSGSITIDTYNQDAYDNGKNKNRYISFNGKIPELIPGTNTITVSEHVTRVEVIPKWWTL